MGEYCDKNTNTMPKNSINNVMREIGVAKVLLNVCVGESGDRLTKAAKVLEQLSGQQPVFRRARYTMRSFAIRRNECISCFVTTRGDKAEELLEAGLKVKEFELLCRMWQFWVWNSGAHRFRNKI